MSRDSEMEIPKINYHGLRTWKQAEADRAATTTPRVDAVAEDKIRFSYQFAVEITELAKVLEKELNQANARIQSLEVIAQSARRDKLNPAPRYTPEPSGLDALSNDEVYERLKRYRCFGMTTRERRVIPVDGEQK